MLGGRRRITQAQPLDPAVFDFPANLPRGSRGLRLLLATAAEFARGWLPDGFEPTGDRESPCVGRLPGLTGEVALRAALVPRPLHLSTWDMANRRPRPTRRLVPAGAVYFFQRTDRSGFSESDFKALWLAPWGGAARDGLGLVAPGRWDPVP
jgi:CRISPR-associated protein Cmr3